MEGIPWFWRDDVINSNTFPWSNAVKERRSILAKEFENLPLESYVASKYEETLREVPHLYYESDYEHRMKEIFYLNLKWFMITLLNRKGRISMSNSLGSEYLMLMTGPQLIAYLIQVDTWMREYKVRIEL